jgi:hypothetical protein
MNEPNRTPAPPRALSEGKPRNRTDDDAGPSQPLLEAPLAPAVDVPSAGESTAALPPRSEWGLGNRLKRRRNPSTES